MLIFITLMLLGILQIFIHKLSHILTIAIGWKWKASAFPLIYYKGDSSKSISADGWALISIMPKLVNIVLIVLSLIFVSFNIAILIGLFNFIDYMVDIFLYIFTNRNNDFMKFNRWLNLSNNFKYLYLLIGIYLGIAIWFLKGAI